MKDFEEMEGTVDVLAGATQDVEGDEDDEDFRPAQAASLNTQDIYYEMEKRGLKTTGFKDTDIAKLQAAFDEEFSRDLELIRAQRRESKRRAAQQAGMQRRRMIMQQMLQEEQEELAANPSVSLIIDTVKTGSTASTLRMDLNSTAARSLGKAMWVNSNIICLDLSSNQLDDHAGKYVARILNRNNIIKKMELDNNHFGPDTCQAFGESLRINTSLTYLSLDSNPLMRKGTSAAKFGEFAEALGVNTTVTSVNLFRTGLTPEGGRALSAAIANNKKLLFCDVAHNNVDMVDMKSIAMSLDRNLSNFDKQSRQGEEDAIKAHAAAMTDQERLDGERKAKELAEWLEKRRADRAAQRRATHDAAVEAEKVAAEERRIKEQKAREAAEKAAIAAAEKAAKKAAKKKKK